MNRLFFILILGCCSVAFSWKRGRQFIPPGTVQITENFFADRHEVTNLSWLEYEYWTGNKFGKNSPERLLVLPDTTVLREVLSYNEPSVWYYYRHLSFRDYPVVGISHRQAQQYSEWRTARVKELYALRYKKEIRIIYRLPTESEWESLSMIGSHVLVNEGLDRKGVSMLNCRLPAGSSDAPVPVGSYAPNRLGLHNLFGNVAEMTNLEGIAKGGSWKHNAEDCRAGKRIRYEKPAAWLGFRNVCNLAPAID